MGEDWNVVELDELSDHDLLVRIATQIECLPALQERVRCLELEVAKLKIWGSLIAAGITATSGIVAAVVAAVLGS